MAQESGTPYRAWPLNRLNGTVRKRVWRHIVATWRDLQVLAREFWVSIAAFIMLLLVGGWLISAHYHDGGEVISFARATYVTFNMIFFQPQLKFPEGQLDLQVLFYALPLLGLIVVVEGVARFGHLVVNKSLRGEEWQRIVASTYKDHIVVCGLGHVGVRVIEHLYDLGQDVVIIARESSFVERAKRAGIPVILGDARDVGLLEAASVARARSIVVATDDDLCNLDIVLSARELNPTIRTVIRLFDTDLGRKMQRALRIDMVFSTSSLSAPAVALSAMSRSVLHSFHVADTLLSVSDLRVRQECPHVGRAIEDLERAEGVTVVVHRTEGQVRVHPQSSDVVNTGDGLIVLADLATIESLLTRGFTAPDGEAMLGAALGSRASSLSAKAARPTG
ncbi:MAG: hypothetical protein EB084_06530 [Proteobacteria bacterium]|nr:hypothetical protein [Pseudomonadota bacterium]